jgi:hypothetical protein
MLSFRRTCVGVHGTTGNKTTLDKLVWITTHDLTVFACSWFALVGVYNKIARSMYR